jgi:hypothetical protein
LVPRRVGCSIGTPLVHNHLCNAVRKQSPARRMPNIYAPVGLQQRQQRAWHTAPIPAAWLKAHRIGSRCWQQIRMPLLMQCSSCCAMVKRNHVALHQPSAGNQASSMVPTAAAVLVAQSPICGPHWYPYSWSGCSITHMWPHWYPYSWSGCPITHMWPPLVSLQLVWLSNHPYVAPTGIPASNDDCQGIW